MKYIFEVDPIGKPRMNRSGVFSAKAKRYWDYCDDVRNEAVNNKMPELPGAFNLTFFIPMPPSWSKSKRAQMNGQPHQSKPDGDNLEKGFIDALCEEDSYIHTVFRRKVWAEKGRIEVDF